MSEDNELAVRPFMLTGGRTRPLTDGLRIETLLSAAPAALSAPLRFEAARIVRLCQAPMSVADLAVALLLYLFGTPGQDRFAFLWDDLVDGALGAVVLLDTRRIEDCFAAIDYFEEHHIPFLIGVNTFDRARRFDLAEVRDALGIDPAVPMVECDARRRESVKGVLVALTEEVLTRRLAVPAW